MQEQKIKKGNRFADLTNKRFGNLIAIKYFKKPNEKKYTWQCVCDCGNTKNIISSNLIRGNSTTCGCGKIKLGEITTKHGMAKTRIFKIWVGVRKRCTNSNCKSYNLYGGRGITISSKWDNFIDYYNDMKEGYSDDLSLDRIDPNGNYEPGNCRWATMKTQNRNKRNNHFVNYDNNNKTLAEWSEISGVDSNVINYRIKNGWDLKNAIYTSTKSASLKSISKYLVF